MTMGRGGLYLPRPCCIALGIAARAGKRNARPMLIRQGAPYGTHCDYFASVLLRKVTETRSVGSSSLG
jgi:hypothetical protein